ncbi:sensor histidine kinase [Granulosicoccus sp. 3-233]
MRMEDDIDTTALQKRLAASEARFDNVVRSSPDGIVVIDHEGIIQYVNPAAVSLFGHAAERLTGESFGYPILIGEKTEIEILKADQKPLLAEMRIVDIEWDEQPAYLATLRDISERSVLLGELQRSTRDLEQFASIVSHDVRSPLRNLYLLTGWLLDDHAAELNADAMEDIQLIRQTTTRMQRLLEDLLHYSRVDRVKRIASNISLDDVLDDALDNLADEIFRTGLQLTREKLPAIDCNVQQMVTFFQHIIGNAIIHNEQKPEVHISCETGPRSCHIRIADNGVGISEANLSNIFIPFNHLHSRDTHDGSGVGLATSKKIIEAHGGKIWIESEIGTGSVVHAEIPKRSSRASGLTKPAK